jgi:hypothetical protein
LAAGAALLVSCAVLSPKRWMWMDELLSHQLAADPSWWHMIVALGDQVDTSPPLYFSLAWLWSAVFGASPLSLRLFSALGFAVAVLLGWRLVRRRFGFWSASLCLPWVFLGSDVLYEQNVQARFYGLFLALAVWAVERCDALIREQRPDKRLLLTNAAAHAGLILVHPFGLVYSGALLAGVLLWDLLQRRWRVRLRVYGSFVLGWAPFFMWLGPFLRQLEVGEPCFWLPVPEWGWMHGGMTLGLELGWPLLAVAAAVVLAWLDRRIENAPPDGLAVAAGRLHLLLLGIVLAFGVPLVAWLWSQIGRPVFLDRYMLPGLLGWVLILALPAGRVDAVWPQGAGAPAAGRWWRRGRQAVVLALVGLALAIPVWRAWHEDPKPVPGRGELVGLPDLPVAVESPHEYLPRRFYHPEAPYVFILDWEAAMQPGGLANSTVDYKVMAAIKRHYPEHAIVSGERFLAEHDRFLLLDEDERLWSEHRLERNPAYRLRRLRGRLHLVERRGARADPSPVNTADRRKKASNSDQ